MPLFSYADSQTIKIIAFGDSLTAGYGLARENSYPAKLEAKLIKDGFKVKVINMGISGETSAGGLARVSSVITENPQVVILALGANDMLRGLSPLEARSSLEHIVYQLQLNKIKVLLLGMKAPINYGVDYAKQFNDIYPEVAKKYNIPLLPFMLEGVALKQEFNLQDGVHPNEKGYDIIVKLVEPYIKKMLN